MPTVLLFRKQAACPTELGLSDLVGGSVGLRGLGRCRRPLYVVDPRLLLDV